MKVYVIGFISLDYKNVWLSRLRTNSTSQGSEEAETADVGY